MHQKREVQDWDSSTEPNYDAYKFGEIEFPEFSRFFRQLQTENVVLQISLKVNLTVFLQFYIILKEHGDWLHPCQRLHHATNFMSLLYNSLHKI